MEKDVGKLMAGKAAWPYLAIKQFEPANIPGMDIETIKKAMDLIFRVMGKNAKEVAVTTGYWNLDLPLNVVTERAKRLCALYKKYNLKQ